MKQNPKFLNSVAQYLMSRTSDFRHTLLVFPNKRSAMYMRRYLRDFVDGPVFLPRMKTIGAFLSSLCPLSEASRLEQLFTLFDAYCKVYPGHSSFDRFRFWGEMLIDDFDDVDSQLVNPEDVFTNVKRLEEIQIDFLDENQRKVAKEIWGYEPETFEGFKNNQRRKNGDDLVYDGFKRLSEILYPVYSEFHSLLKQRGLTTRGMIARHAAQNIDTLMDNPHTMPRNIVFIGFGVLSRSVHKVFHALHKGGRATFFWDLPDMMQRDLPEEISRYRSPLLKYVEKIVGYFPMPDDFQPPQFTDTPEIYIVGVPSKTLQTKIVGNIVSSLETDKLLDTNRADNSVIVLPDSSILIPLLHALDVKKVNVTMGVPIRHTPFATLLSMIIRLNMSAQIDKEGHTFFLTKNVIPILSHPSLTVLMPRETARLRHKIEKTGRFVTRLDTIIKEAPELSFIFRPIGEENTAKEAWRFIEGLIDGMIALVDKVSTGNDSASPDYENSRLHEYRVLVALRRALDNLVQIIENHSEHLDINNMSHLSFIRLVEKQLNHVLINYSGSPLVGLQIMGSLETRSLDFDNVIMLSMNEKTFPPKNFVRSLIPPAIRAGYGLTTVEERELEYAWIYAGLLSRCNRAFLVYDSASESTGKGSMSRYLFQSRYIYNRPGIKKIDIVPGGKTEPSTSIVIHKTPQVLAELERFKAGGDRNLSVSALERYGMCPLSFYLSRVKRIKEYTEPSETVDDATIGTVVHAVMERIFKEKLKTNQSRMDDSFVVTQQNIVDIFTEELGVAWYRKFEMTYSEMPPAMRLQIDVWSERIMRIFEAERKVRQPYLLEGCEIEPRTIIGSHSFDWEISPELTVRFTFFIDRADRLDDGSLRFVDYKTGRDKLEVKDMDNLFWNIGTESNEAPEPNNAIFQLLTYANAYVDIMKVKDLPYDGNIALEITQVVHPEDSVGAVLKIDGQPIVHHNVEAVADFMPRFRSLVSSIFNPAIPFTQTPHLDHCKYCQFKNICQRNPQTP